MSFTCNQHGWSHLLAACPYCFQYSMSGDATDISKITFSKEQAIDLAIETWKAREVCWNTERERLRSKLSAVEKELDHLRDFRKKAIVLLDGYYEKVEPLIQERDSLKSRLAVAVGALEEVASHAGMTNLGGCCVDKSCHPMYEDGEKVAHCSFGFGVNRGFNECASTASEALKAINETK